MFAGIEKHALAVAADESGIAEEIVAKAVHAYRRAASRLEVEPEWQALMHMSGKDYGIAQYGADGTKVTKQIESWKSRSDQWQSESCYTFAGKPFETFGEARAVELQEQKKDCAVITPLAPR